MVIKTSLNRINHAIFKSNFNNKPSNVHKPLKRFIY